MTLKHPRSFRLCLQPDHPAYRCRSDQSTLVTKHVTYLYCLIKFQEILLFGKREFYSRGAQETETFETPAIDAPSKIRRLQT